jgi:hypothetical protein
LKESLVDFLDFIFTQGSTFRISLYNYDNLPYLSKDITYDFFERHVDESFEINSVYDYRSENKIKEKFEKILDLIQYVSNDYGKYGEEYGEEEEDEYGEEDEEEYGEEEYGEEDEEEYGEEYGEEEDEIEDEKLWKKKHSRIS